MRTLLSLADHENLINTILQYAAILQVTHTRPIQYLPGADGLASGSTPAYELQTAGCAVDAISSGTEG